MVWLRLLVLYAMPRLVRTGYYTNRIVTGFCMAQFAYQDRVSPHTVTEAGFYKERISSARDKDTHHGGDRVPMWRPLTPAATWVRAVSVSDESGPSPARRDLSQ